MNLYWVHSTVKKDQIHVFFLKGSPNMADYVTKYHLVHNHGKMKLIYHHNCNIFGEMVQPPWYRHLKGCAETGGFVDSQSNPESKIQIRNNRFQRKPEYIFLKTCPTTHLFMLQVINRQWEVLGSINIQTSLIYVVSN